MKYIRLFREGKGGWWELEKVEVKSEQSWLWKWLEDFFLQYFTGLVESVRIYIQGKKQLKSIWVDKIYRQRWCLTDSIPSGESSTNK